jgi:hypothetical protein
VHVETNLCEVVEKLSNLGAEIIDIEIAELEESLHCSQLSFFHLLFCTGSKSCPNSDYTK